jgi:hypothetical protein
LHHEISKKVTLNAGIKMIYLFQNGNVVEMKEISDFKDGETYYLMTEIDGINEIKRLDALDYHLLTNNFKSGHVSI